MLVTWPRYKDSTLIENTCRWLLWNVLQKKLWLTHEKKPPAVGLYHVLASDGKVMHVALAACRPTSPLKLHLLCYAFMAALPCCVVLWHAEEKREFCRFHELCVYAHTHACTTFYADLNWHYKMRAGGLPKRNSRSPDCDKQLDMPLKRWLSRLCGCVLLPSCSSPYQGITFSTHNPECNQSRVFLSICFNWGLMSIGSLPEFSWLVRDELEFKPRFFRLSAFSAQLVALPAW